MTLFGAAKISCKNLLSSPSSQQNRTFNNMKMNSSVKMEPKDNYWTNDTGFHGNICQGVMTGGRTTKRLGGFLGENLSAMEMRTVDDVTSSPDSYVTANRAVDVISHKSENLKSDSREITRGDKDDEVKESADVRMLLCTAKVKSEPKTDDQIDFSKGMQDVFQDNQTTVKDIIKAESHIIKDAFGIPQIAVVQFTFDTEVSVIEGDCKADPDPGHAPKSNQQLKDENGEHTEPLCKTQVIKTENEEKHSQTDSSDVTTCFRADESNGQGKRDIPDTFKKVKSKTESVAVSTFSGENPSNAKCRTNTKRGKNNQILGPQARKSDKVESCKLKRPRTISETDSKKNSKQKICNTTFVCDICDKTFHSKDKLTRHSYVHGAEKPYKCDVCGKGFLSRRELKTHSYVHSDDKPFKCDICGHGYVSAKVLRIHGITHTGEQPFQCDICQKKFSRKANMQRHMLTHSDVKPFKCDVCQKAFFSTNALNFHVSTVHSEKKAFECSECGKKFSAKSRLTAHFAKHVLPYSCNVCGKKFASKISLQCHLATHTGIKPHACKLCTKAFAVPSVLAAHVRKRHGDI